MSQIATAQSPDRVDQARGTGPAVVVEDLVKDFPTLGGAPVRAVDHVSLQIADGEFFALLGPSGCGKSTLLRMLAGLETPDSGRIWIEGQPMEGVPPEARPVNMVFQSYALFPHLSVAGNVGFGLEMRARPAAEIRRRVEIALEMVRLGGLGERRPSQLSGGQQQRVALARAIINEPEVLLLDEPLGALDMKLRKEMQLELKSLQRRLGITFVHVTHDQEEALAMCDRIAVMDVGRLLQLGPPTQIYERPASRFVADFIGEANFLDGTVASVSGTRATVDLAGEPRQVAGIAHQGCAVGQAVTLAVRPEKLRLSAEKPAADNCFAASVQDVAYIGSDTRVTVRLGETVTLVAWDTNDVSTLDPEAYYRVGEALWVSWPAENALVLVQ